MKRELTFKELKIMDGYATIGVAPSPEVSEQEALSIEASSSIDGYDVPDENYDEGPFENPEIIISPRSTPSFDALIKSQIQTFDPLMIPKNKFEIREGL